MGGEEWVVWEVWLGGTVVCSVFPSTHARHRAVPLPALAAALRWTHGAAGPSLTGEPATSEKITVPDDRAAEPALPNLLRAVLYHGVFAGQGSPAPLVLTASGTDARKAALDPRFDDDT